MSTVREIEQMLFAWAPRELAMGYDNVGLLVGDPNAPVERILVSLDITEAVAEEAKEIGAQLIVSHHPVMNCTWHPVQTLRADDRQGRILTGLVRSGIAAVCMHTNLDAAEGGVNDVLALRLGLEEIEPLSEEKIGRIGTLKCEIPLVEFTGFVLKSLRCNGLRYTDRGKPVRRVAVGGGSCGDLIGQAIARGCDTFVTSDLKYHDFLDATEINLIDAGHFPTEDVICPVLAERLSAAFPAVQVQLSARHSREVIQYCMKEI
ncbi:MAG: Nif3-like dinuclear metal center hexameric protein [Oscillospiraceae bacterium]|nr:Nif3-like dinuclear metal center hexameric protein [Oscillospiraceae bacterium]